MTEKTRASNNRTIVLTESDRIHLRPLLARVSKDYSPQALIDVVLHQDCEEAAEFLPRASVDLLFLDPPYNQDKSFASTRFQEMSSEAYGEWVESWLAPLIHSLKESASIYFCANWRSSAAVQRVLEKYFTLRNRITWEREKGRGADSNWKSTSEDIWFCTMSNDYRFNKDAVMLKRRVVAPYTTAEGAPKDWSRSGDTGYRLTHPSNLWTDLTVPFWSMPENTDHPTQKPEKLLAKILLASTSEGDTVLDPFLGSGTTAAVARKLDRHWIGIERNEEFALLALKRIQLAEHDRTIQGLQDGVFWERNSAPKKKPEANSQ